MTRGLVRKNNLSDLQNPEQARINLGLQTNDYERIRGLFSSANLTAAEVGRIANSTSNFQEQINASSATLGTILPALYANKAGDTLTGTWTNRGNIGATNVIVSGITLSGSTDALFSRSLPLSSFGIETPSGVMPSGLSTNNIRSNGNVVIVSGITASSTMAIQVGGFAYKIELA